MLARWVNTFSGTPGAPCAIARPAFVFSSSNSCCVSVMGGTEAWQVSLHPGKPCQDSREGESLGTCCLADGRDDGPYGGAQMNRNASYSGMRLEGRRFAFSAETGRPCARNAGTGGGEMGSSVHTVEAHLKSTWSSKSLNISPLITLVLFKVCKIIEKRDD